VDLVATGLAPDLLDHLVGHDPGKDRTTGSHDPPDERAHATSLIASCLFTLPQGGVIFDV
jgi:hypothetical protein